MGTTSFAHNYLLTDTKATNDLLNYRLRQIDLDGSEHILGTIVVAPDANLQYEQLSIYPNPVSSKGKIDFTISAPEVVRVSIVNELGYELCVLANAPYMNGSYSLQLDTKNFTSGYYHLIFTTPTQRVVKEFLIVK